MSPFVAALRELKKVRARLRKEGFSIRFLDMGGGLGVPYDDEKPPAPQEYADALLKELGDETATLVLEPGRVVMGNAGILVSKVLYTKYAPHKKFVVVDTGMNDIIRPSLYGAFQDIIPVRKAAQRTITADVVGPICESADFIARRRRVPEVQPGEYLAVMGAGAYGFSMSSNYNSRPRAAEVLIRGKKAMVIRRRESYEDLIRGEQGAGGE